MMLVWLTLLVPAVSARPSDDRKIIFDDDDLVSSKLAGHHCDLEGGEVLWEEDGGCYMIGERGPCSAGETVQLIRGRPACVRSGPVGGECHQSWQVSVEGGGCEDLLSPGPCPHHHWVVLQPRTMTGVCEARRCVGDEVWLGAECRCVGQAEGKQHCGEHAGLVWSPLGEGVCVCSEDYYADSDGVCHELGSSAPCQQDQVWLLDDSGLAHCGVDSNQVRLFELLSSKSNKGSNADTAQSQGCFVDENGRCRKTLNIRGRFGEEDGEVFLDWLAGFKPGGSTCPPAGVVPCEEEEGESVLWSDGKCYQLASTGPCEAGHWLVLTSSPGLGYYPHCQERDCPQDEVLWSPTCSCFPTQANNTLRSHLSPCSDGERLLVSPYGDGVCAQIEEENSLKERLFDLLSSSSSQSSAAATRKNCFLDENKKCRKTLNIRGRIDTGETDPLQDILTWLDQFPKPSKCEELEDNDDKQMRRTESECHSLSQVLYEDGNCYNLLELGPCSDQAMWLVMALQADGSLAAECKPRKCPSNDTIFDPESCQCEDTGDVGSCDSGERLYQDIFGVGVCGCREGYEAWAETGDCQHVGDRGPCSEGQIFTYQPLTQTTQCTDNNNNTRVFDIIPATGFIF